MLASLSLPYMCELAEICTPDRISFYVIIFVRFLAYFLKKETVFSFCMNPRTVFRRLWTTLRRVHRRGGGAVVLLPKAFGKFGMFGIPNKSFF